MKDKVNNWLGSRPTLISFGWQNLMVILVAVVGFVLLLAHPSFLNRLCVYRVGIVVCSLFFPVVVYFHGRFDSPRLLVYTVIPFFCSINISFLHNGLASYDFLWDFYGQYLWLLIGFWISKNISSLKFLGFVYVFGIGCISGYALLQQLDFDPLPAVTVFESRRLVSTFENPNYFANILACSLPILGYYFVNVGHSRVRWLIGIVSVLTYNSWIFAGSRGAWVGGMIGLIAFSVISVTSRVDMKFDHKKALISYLVLFCFIVGIVVYASEKIVIANAQGELSVYERLLSIGHVFDPREVGDFSRDVGPASLQIGDTFIHDTTINHRYFIWDVTWGIINENPIVGVGPGGFAIHFIEYRDAFLQHEWGNGLSDQQRIDETKFSHNEFLHIWAECGALGLLSFLWLCCFPTFSYIRKLREVPLICGAIFSFLLVMLVHGQVSYPLRTPVGSFFFWLNFGVFIGLLQEDRKKKIKTIKEF